MNPPKSLYLGSLDGLRVLAFLSVSVHHFTGFRGHTLNQYGWVGVELFFVISSFLFFHLLQAERDKVGTISIRNFYIRRVLRIYPLMVVFPLLMLAIYGPTNDLAALRFAGIAFFSDNILGWFYYFNDSIPYTTHLWTLSFEFQIYAVLPFLFLLQSRNRKMFAISLLICSGIAMLSRFMLFDAGSKQPIVVWVTPFLRPESIFLGMAMAVYRPKWHWAYSALAFLVLLALVVSLPAPWRSVYSAIYGYPLIGLMCASLVDVSLRCPAICRALSLSPLRMLGRVSFGLYVYHLWSFRLAGTFFPGLPIVGNYIVAIAICIGIASISFFAIERPIERLKLRFTAIDGRAPYPASRQPSTVQGRPLPQGRPIFQTSD